jgi:hypothetical protein
LVNTRKKTDDKFSDHPYGLQAFYSIYGEGIQDTFERETKALKQLDAFLSLKWMLIVTYDEDGSVPLENGKMIEVIPTWKWLL